MYNYFESGSSVTVSNTIIEDDEDNRLKHWRKWMDIRKRFHEIAREKLGRNTDNMVINKLDAYRTKIQDRLKIQYAKVLKPDKYRGCPSFWTMPLEVKNSILPPLYGVLTKEQKCEIPVLEYIGVPKAILDEKGITPRVDINIWEQSEYKKRRESEIKKRMKRSYPYKPDIEELCVIGKGILKYEPTSTISTMQESDSFYTCEYHVLGEEDITIAIQIEDIVLSSKSKAPLIKKCYYAIDYYIPDDGVVKNKLTLKNLGSTVIKYMWKRVYVEKNLSIIPKREPVIAFCFKKIEEMLLMDKSVDIDIYFSTKTPGFYEEIWELHTTPVINPGIRFYLVLWAFAELANFDVICQSVQDRIDQGIKHKAVDETIVELLSRVHTIKPSEKVVESEVEVSEKNIFEALNMRPGDKPLQPMMYYYDRHVINQLKDLYDEVRLHDDPIVWSLRIRDLEEAIERLEDHATKEAYALELTGLLSRLFRTDMVKNTDKDKHAHIYYLLCTTIDQITDRVFQIRKNFHIKVRETYPKDSIDNLYKESNQTSHRQIVYFPNIPKRKCLEKNILDNDKCRPMECLKVVAFDEPELMYNLYHKEKYGIVDMPKAKSAVKAAKGAKSANKSKQKEKDKSKDKLKEVKSTTTTIKHKDVDDLSLTALLSTDDELNESTSESEDFDEIDISMYNYNIYMIVYELLGNAVDDITYAIESFTEKSVPHVLLKKLLEQPMSFWESYYQYNKKPTIFDSFDNVNGKRTQSDSSFINLLSAYSSEKSVSLSPSAISSQTKINYELVEDYTETSEPEVYPARIKDINVQTMYLGDLEKECLTDQIELEKKSTSIYSMN